MDLPSLAHTLLSPYTPQHQRAEANASLVSMLQQDDLPYHANILVTQQTGYEFLGLTMMCEWIKIRGGKGCQEGVEEWAKSLPADAPSLITEKLAEIFTQIAIREWPTNYKSFNQMLIQLWNQNRKKLVAHIIRHLIEEIMIFTNPIVDARKKDLNNALLCILEAHTDQPVGETSKYIDQKRAQMDAVGIVFPDEGWLRRLAINEKDCLYVLELCMEWIAPDALVDANVLAFIFSQGAFSTLLPLFGRRQPTIADRIAMFHPFFSDDALSFLQRSEGADRDRMIRSMSRPLLSPKYSEDLPGTFPMYNDLLVTSMESSTYNLFEGFETHLLLLLDPRSKPIALSSISRVAVMVYRRYRDIFAPYPDDMSAFDDGGELDRWAMSARSQVLRWVSLLVQNDLAQLLSQHLELLLRECIHSGIGQIWKSFNALFAAFINACPTMISHFVPILLDLQLPQNDLVNQIICLDSCNLAFDKSPEGAANHPTWIIRMLDKYTTSLTLLHPNHDVQEELRNKACSAILHLAHNVPDLLIQHFQTLAQMIVTISASKPHEGGLRNFDRIMLWRALIGIIYPSNAIDAATKDSAISALFEPHRLACEEWIRPNVTKSYAEYMEFIGISALRQKDTWAQGELMLYVRRISEQSYAIQAIEGSFVETCRFKQSIAPGKNPWESLLCSLIPAVCNMTVYLHKMWLNETYEEHLKNVIKWDERVVTTDPEGSRASPTESVLVNNKLNVLLTYCYTLIGTACSNMAFFREAQTYTLLDQIIDSAANIKFQQTKSFIKLFCQPLLLTWPKGSLNSLVPLITKFMSQVCQVINEQSERMKISDPEGESTDEEIADQSYLTDSTRALTHLLTSLFDGPSNPLVYDISQLQSKDLPDRVEAVFGQTPRTADITAILANSALCQILFAAMLHVMKWRDTSSCVHVSNVFSKILYTTSPTYDRWFVTELLPIVINNCTKEYHQTADAPFCALIAATFQSGRRNMEAELISALTTAGLKAEHMQHLASTLDDNDSKKSRSQIASIIRNEISAAKPAVVDNVIAKPPKRSRRTQVDAATEDYASIENLDEIIRKAEAS